MKKWLFIVLFIIPLSVSAVASDTGVEPDLIEFKPAIAGLDLTGCSAVADRGNFLGCYISALYTFLVQAAVILAVLMIIVGGFQYLLALGDTGKISDAKETIEVAIIGLVLALCSYLLFALVNNQIVALKPLNIPDARISPTAPLRPGFKLVICSEATSVEECQSKQDCLWADNACVNPVQLGSEAITNYCNAKAGGLYDSNTETSNNYRFICCSHVDNPSNVLLAVPKSNSKAAATLCNENLVSPNSQYPFQAKSIIECQSTINCN